MITAVQESTDGFSTGLPDWERERLAQEDPFFYGHLVAGDDLVIEGSQQEPHTLRGIDSADFNNGMHIIKTAGMSGETKGG